MIRGRKRVDKKRKRRPVAMTRRPTCMFWKDSAALSALFEMEEPSWEMRVMTEVPASMSVWVGGVGGSFSGDEERQEKIPIYL